MSAPFELLINFPELAFNKLSTFNCAKKNDLNLHAAGFPTLNLVKGGKRL